MKLLIPFLFILFITGITFAQPIPKGYNKLVKMADSLYKVKDYKTSALMYSEAFRTDNNRGDMSDRYNAACSWALAGIYDSAFYHLEFLASKDNYADYKQITNDTDLTALHVHKRWEALLEEIRLNKQKAEEHLNKPLMAILDTIRTEDQKYRMQLSKLEKQYGFDSKEVKDLWVTIGEKDSFNLVKVKAILDQYGWLGTDEIGIRGNTTLFLVIQHSDQATQEKYLPMMREAVKNGKAPAANLALLEDRVALGQGKLQIYGSQIGRDPDTNQYYVLPLKDPDNVDKRRAQVELGTLANYVSRWKIEWNVEQYKKDLPELIKKSKRK